MTRLLGGLLTLFWLAVAAGTAHGGEAVGSGSTPAAVHPAWADFEPRFRRHICPFGAGLQYDPEVFVCGYVLVPEDRTDPDSRLIRLSVLKIVSAAEQPAAGALIRLTGGPGGPSLSAGRIRAHQAPENQFLRQVADLVFFDQRGVGYSGAAFCRAIPLSYQFGVPTGPDGLRRLRQAIGQCMAEARAQGVAVGAYSTGQNALDVRDIRRALGYRQWNLFAVSYGTELAQAVMAADPEGVRSAVLESVLPLDIDPDDPRSTLAAGFRSSLEVIDAICRQDPACAAAYDSLSERLVAAFRSYEADPLILTDLDITKSQGGRLVVDGTVAAGAVFQALYRQRIYGDLPSVLRVLERRDAEALGAYVQLLGYSIDHAYGHGLSWVANCRGASRDRGGAGALAAIARQEPELSQWMGTIPFTTQCDAVYPGPRDPSVGPLASDIPTLVAAGRVDPVTPPHLSRRILAGLSRARYVEFPYTGHAPLASHFPGCGGRLLRDFIVDPEADLDLSCAEQTRPPEFLINVRETKGPFRLALRLQRQDYPLALLVGVGGLAAALLGFPLGAAARRLDGDPATPLGGARLLSWAGAAASLGGITLALGMILRTAGEHPAALPLGVPPAIAWAGWLAVAGTALALAGAVQLHRGRGQGRPRAATTMGIYATVGLATYGLWYLVELGAGPLW